MASSGKLFTHFEKGAGGGSNMVDGLLLGGLRCRNRDNGPASSGLVRGLLYTIEKWPMIVAERSGILLLVNNYMQSQFLESQGSLATQL